MKFDKNESTLLCKLEIAVSENGQDYYRKPAEMRFHLKRGRNGIKNADGRLWIRVKEENGNQVTMEISADRLEKEDFLEIPPKVEFLFPMDMRVQWVKEEGIFVDDDGKRLLETYFFPYLSGSYLLKDLVQEMSVLLSDIVDMYAQSWAEHWDEIRETNSYSQNSYEIQSSYEICIRDPIFQENIQLCQELFYLKAQAHKITDADIQTDQESLLQKLLYEFIPEMNKIKKEMARRLETQKSVGTSASAQLALDDARKKGKAFCERDVVDLDKLRELRRMCYEDKTTVGIIMSKERENYVNLIRCLNNELQEMIDKSLQIEHRMTMAFINDYNAAYDEKVNRAWSRGEYFNNDFIPELSEYIKHIQEEYTTRLNQINWMQDEQRILKRKKESEKLVSKFTSQISEKLSDKENLLACWKRAVISKTRNLSGIKRADIQKNQIIKLLKQDIPMLMHLICVLEGLGGCTNLCLEKKDENLAEILFGKQYRYLTKDEFFEKLRDMFQKSDLEENVICLRYAFNSALTRYASMRGDYREEIKQVLGIDAETLMNEEKKELDIKKIVELRKKLYQDYEQMGEQTVKETVLKTEMAKKILFVEEKILQKTETDGKISAGERYAYETLSKAVGILPAFQQEFKQRDQYFKQLEAQSFELYEKIYNTPKFLKALAGIEKKERHHKELELKIEEYQKSGYDDFVQKLLVMANELQSSLSGKGEEAVLAREAEAVKEIIMPLVSKVKGIMGSFQVQAGDLVEKEGIANRKVAVFFMAMKYCSLEEIKNHLLSGIVVETDEVHTLLKTEFESLTIEALRELLLVMEEIKNSREVLRTQKGISQEGFQRGIDLTLQENDPFTFTQVKDLLGEK